MDGAQRRLLGWLGAGVGLLAAAMVGGWLWLTRIVPLDEDLRLLAAGVGLAALIMGLRCGRIARAR
jgi:hypothetical protein